MSGLEKKFIIFNFVSREVFKGNSWLTVSESGFHDILFSSPHLYLHASLDRL